MKTNKKAILGMLVAMVMSLGVMNGINDNSIEPRTTQQWGLLSYMYADQAESTAGEVVGQTLGAAFTGAAGGIILAGFAAGGVPGIALGVSYGVIVGL
jgi:hypothetical protein